ncbi:MAG: RidA family protein [Wenzhouxiangellaceae bacterium]
MKRTRLTPTSFTPTMGSYSHGIKVNPEGANWVFVTGQIAMDSNGNVVSNDIETQARFVFENIKTILFEAGATMDDVVKAQIFLTDISDFTKVSLIRNEYFTNSEPVSTLVQVEALVKKGCKIEVEVIALCDK